MIMDIKMMQTFQSIGQFEMIINTNNQKLRLCLNEIKTFTICRIPL